MNERTAGCAGRGGGNTLKASTRVVGQDLVGLLAAHTAEVRRATTRADVDGNKAGWTITAGPGPVVPLILTFTTTGTAAAVARIDRGA